MVKEQNLPRIHTTDYNYITNIYNCFVRSSAVYVHNNIISKHLITSQRSQKQQVLPVIATLFYNMDQNIWNYIQRRTTRYLTISRLMGFQRLLYLKLTKVNFIQRYYLLKFKINLLEDTQIEIPKNNSTLSDNNQVAFIYRKLYAVYIFLSAGFQKLFKNRYN